LDDFLAFSARITDFTVFSLQGTGLARRYLATVSDIVGEAALGELLDVYRTLEPANAQAAPGDAALDRQLRAGIFSHPKFGPVARNLIKLWYVGIWYQLPREWRDAFGIHGNDTTFVVSPAAYTEGLLWKAIDANPSGAKGPGYGTWQDPPNI
jgi:hypothetical protein